MTSDLQFQQREVDNYCSKHLQGGSKFDLPTGQVERELLYRHLLFDDLREMIFCFVEKIGEGIDLVEGFQMSTNMRGLFVRG